MDNKLIDLQSVCNKIISFNLGVKKDEQVFIVADTFTDMRIAYALASAVESVGAEYTIAIMPARKISNEKQMKTTDIIAKGAEEADVYIALTRANQASILDKRIVDLILDKRFRDCTITGRDIENFLRGGALADYEKVNSDGIRLKQEWDKMKTFKIKSPSGTYLTGELNEADSVIGCGVAREKGTSMAFSDGEVSSTPKKGSVNGVLVVDGPIYNFGLPKEPLKLTVKNSRVISVDSGDESIVSGLKEMLRNVENSDYLAEVAIGLNPCSLKNGEFMEEKKAYGNIHIALGDNTYWNGDVESQVHIDMVIKEGTFIMDGIDFVRDGEVTILK